MFLSNRSQVWVEAILLVFIFASVLAFVALTSNNINSSLFKQNLVYQAREVLELVSSRVNTVLFEGSGFSSNLVIPEKISDIDYNISFSQDYVVLGISNMTLLSQNLAKSVVGKIQKGENWVKNKNGTIYIN